MNFLNLDELKVFLKNHPSVPVVIQGKIPFPGAEEFSRCLWCYTQLTDTLRNYIQERYGFNAMEMTSGEIIERLTEENDEEALAELRELFQTADLVKFAKWTTLINENDANLMTALEYINQTKQEEDPNQPQEEVIVTPEARRQRATIWSMRVTIIVGSIVGACMLGWIIYRMIDLLR